MLIDQEKDDRTAGKNVKVKDNDAIVDKARALFVHELLDQS